MRKTARSCLRDGSLMVKLVAKKEEREERVREVFFGSGLRERKLGGKEN